MKRVFVKLVRSICLCGNISDINGTVMSVKHFVDYHIEVQSHIILMDIINSFSMDIWDQWLPVLLAL